MDFTSTPVCAALGSITFLKAVGALLLLYIGVSLGPRPSAALVRPRQAAACLPQSVRTRLPTW